MKNTIGELTNHLGNVMAVISDEASTADEPTVVSLSDYYPFGMSMPERSWNAYRYGFNFQENQNINNLLTDGVNLLATMTKKQQ